MLLVLLLLLKSCSCGCLLLLSLPFSVHLGVHRLTGGLEDERGKRS